MTDESETSSVKERRGGLDWLHVLLIVMVVIMVTAGVTYWIVRTNLFPSAFQPVTLTEREQRVLNLKLQKLESLPWSSSASGDAQGAGPSGSATSPAGEILQPEPYSEVGASREIAFTEREINAMLARNTDLASKLAIDLSGDLISAKLLLPLDEDFPFFGGQTLKVRAGVGLAYGQGRPIVVLKGVSIMGVPLPNAWLGGIKNIDLVREYGEEEGFWKSFADGISDVHVSDGQLLLMLKE